MSGLAVQVEPEVGHDWRLRAVCGLVAVELIGLDSLKYGHTHNLLTVFVLKIILHWIKFDI